MARRNPSVATGVALAALVGGAVLIWAFYDAAPTSVPGVTVSSTAVVGDRQWRFLAKLRARVPASVPIHVTSGGRTYEEQATLMMRKWVQYPDEFKQIYNVAATRLLKLPYSYDVWLAEIRKLYAEGILHADGHIGGGAVDLRTRDLPPGGLDAIRNAALSIKAKPLTEADHLHIDILSAA